MRVSLVRQPKRRWPVVTSLQMQGQFKTAEANPPAATFYGLAELLWRRRWWLCKSAAVGFVIAVLVALLIPKRYESTTRLMPPDSQSVSGAGMAAIMGNLSSSTAALAGNFLGIKSPGALLVGVLESRTVQDDLINRQDLRRVYGLQRYVDARKKLASRTAIADDTKSGIITITVTDNDPNRAQALAAGYVEELNNLVSQVSTSSARREREFLEQRLQKVKQDLDEATLRLSKFSSQNMTFDPQLQGRAMLDAASTLQGQLIAAESELSGLQQIYGPQNARVKSAEARVGELRFKLRSISGRNVAGGGASSNGPALSNNELYPSLEQLPLLSNTYADLARRAKIDEAIFEVLTKQYELAKVQEAKEIPTVKILDAADVPEKKSFPPRTLIALLGACLGFTLAAAWTLLLVVGGQLDADDPRRRVLGELLKKLGMEPRREGLELPNATEAGGSVE